MIRNTIFSMTSPSGLLYTLNKVGPRTEPCGTPYFITSGLEKRHAWPRLHISASHYVRAQRSRSVGGSPT